MTFESQFDQAPSTDGKEHFVGCSEWIKAEEWEHIYALVPSCVNETIPPRLVNGECVESPDLSQYE